MNPEKLKERLENIVIISFATSRQIEPLKEIISELIDEIEFLKKTKKNRITEGRPR